MRRQNTIIKVLFTFCIAWIINFSVAEKITPFTGVNAHVIINDQNSFMNWLDSTGRPSHSRYLGYPANYAVFRDYNLLSYGKPQDIPGNRYSTSAGEYEAHGYSYDEYVLYNSFFPEDMTSVTDPRLWNRVNLGTDAAVSWMRLTSREKEHIKNAGIYYMGESYGGMNYSQLNLTEAKCVVLAVPSMDLGFALHTNHISSGGSLWYATFHGNGIGSYSVSAVLGPVSGFEGSTAVIGADDDYVDVTYRVRCIITSYQGLARSSDIMGGGILFRGRSWEKAGYGPWESFRTVRYMRTNYGNTRQIRSVNENAVFWVSSKMGDLKSFTMNYNLSIVEEPKSFNEINAVFTMKGEIGAFDGSYSLLGKMLPENKNRFVSLERINLKIEFKDSFIPESVIVFPVGYMPLTLAVEKTGINSGYAHYSYTMGIIRSTLDWDNKRIRQPYTAYAMININGKTKIISVGGIEITGSVHDLIYINDVK